MPLFVLFVFRIIALNLSRTIVGKHLKGYTCQNRSEE